MTVQTGIGMPYGGVSGVTVSTADVPLRDRREWLQDTIRREYTRVEVMPPADGALFNEMTIYEWARLRLSVVRSNAISLNRLAHEPYHAGQDSYLGVVLLDGSYLLEQNGREVFLQPGDMALYDATRPHRIHCPRAFTKLIVTIPRHLLRSRFAGVEQCVARLIPGREGIGHVAAGFIRDAAAQASRMDLHAFGELAEHSLDLFTLALAAVRPQAYTLSRSRSLSLERVKAFVARHLADPALDSAMVGAGTGLTPRYINELFRDEQTSLMRHVWQSRLEHCRRDLLSPVRRGQSISEIALLWGFNDLSHFSRAFRQRFGCSPRELRRQPLV